MSQNYDNHYHTQRHDSILNSQENFESYNEASHWML